jgi:hypothetical protein
MHFSWPKKNGTLKEGILSKYAKYTLHLIENN